MVDLVQFTQAVSTSSAFVEFIGSIVFLCYIARNWPPEIGKLRYQLSFALFMVFISVSIRDVISTVAWWHGEEGIMAFIKEWRLVAQVPKIGLIVGVLIAIRAITFEVYRNTLVLLLLGILAAVFVFFLFFQPIAALSIP